MAATLPQIDPPPPAAPAWLPRIGAGLSVLRDPTAFFTRTRARLGDTYQVDLFGNRLLCFFSPVGVKNLWAVPEEHASKGVADFLLLRHKVPDELFAGRRTFPHHLFGSQDVETYLDALDRAIGLQLAELGSAGELEVFAFTRRLGHRLGLACWGGIEAASEPWLDRLIPALDRLDGSDSFVHPQRAFRAVLTRKRAERRALATLDAAFGEILSARAARGDAPGDFLDRIFESWSDVPSPEREIGAGRDVILSHMGSMSNLFAAMGWTLVHLLERPGLLARVRAGDLDLLDRCANESIRLMQRSIVLRRVLRPVEIADERTTWRVPAGAFLATMVSVTNTTAGEGLDRFDPDHYDGRKFLGADALPARELVVTFGHGRHACPAQRFSITAIRRSLHALSVGFELDRRFGEPRALRHQIGGVARADRACRVGYRAAR